MTALSLASIHIHPVKSLGGFEVPQVRTTDRGLEHDRRWMLVDGTGRFLSQRVLPIMACLYCGPHAAGFRVTDVRGGRTIDLPWAIDAGERIEAHVWDDAVNVICAPEAWSEWFSETLGQAIRLVHMPDSTKRQVDPKYAHAILPLSDAFPCLVISQTSLDDLNTRLAKAVPMDRFRPNLVVAGGVPYQEDQWKVIDIGDLAFQVVKPCARCVIITTDQRTGARGDEPLRTLATYRSAGNKVLFGMNATFEGSGILRVGDKLRVGA